MGTDPHHTHNAWLAGSMLSGLVNEVDAPLGPRSPSGLLAEQLALPRRVPERRQQVIEAIQVTLDVAGIQRAISFR